MRYESSVIELKIQRLIEEIEFQKETKTLDANFKSYRDFFMNKVLIFYNKMKRNLLNV